MLLILWVVGMKNQNGNMKYIFDADAFITKGTAKLVIDILNNESADRNFQIKKRRF